MFDKVLAFKSFTFLDENKIIANLQFGCRDTYDTIEHNYRITNDTWWVFKMKDSCSAIMLEYLRQLYEELVHDFQIQ